MREFFKIFYWGMLISFLSTLPPGIMNIVGTQISNSRGTGEAILYVTGFMLAEVIIVRLALSGMRWLTRSQRFFRLLEWMTAAILVVFSMACFIATDSMRQVSGTFPGFELPSFIKGIIISLINPMHIPFWLTSSTVLMNKGILSPQPKQYNLYIVGIGTGTIAGFITFLSGGTYVLKAFQSNQYLINCIVGLVLFITALMHIKKMIVVPVAARHAKLFRQS
jgi:threonine/homoserine/homoserine lactone efflux protein